LRHSKDGSLRSESPENGLLGGENSQDGTAEVIENPEGTAEGNDNIINNLSDDGVNGNLLASMISAVQEKAAEEAAADDPQSLILSRLYAYLKPDAKTTAKTNSSTVNAVNAVNAVNGEKEEKEEDEKTLSSQAGGSAASSVFLPEAAGVSSLSEDKVQGKNQGTGADRFVSDAKGKDPSDKGVDTGADAGVKTDAAETAKFDRFFEGVVALSRRGSSETLFDAEVSEGLELAKESPLSRNEALREGLDNVVRFIRTSGEQKAALIVDPPALGRVSVELTDSAAGLEASIKVGSEQIRQLVQDQLAQLRLTLAQQGVQLTHFSVDVQQDGGQRQQQQNTGRGRQFGGPGNEEENEEQTVFRVDLERGLLYWVA
jgi:flagellar hook-length control protein FliK